MNSSQAKQGGLFGIGSSPTKSSGNAPIPFVGPQKRGSQEISLGVREKIVFAHDDGTQHPVNKEEIKAARKAFKDQKGQATKQAHERK